MVMYLRAKCRNGHWLKVPHRFAGQEGVCPICGEKVKVPPLQREEFSDDAVLDQMGNGGTSPSTISRYAATRDDLPTQEELGALDDGFETDGSSLMRIRKCPKCEKDVPPKHHVCPHCRMYLLEDSEVDETKATMACPTCGARSFPGKEVCEQCGTQLFLRE